LWQPFQGHDDEAAKNSTSENMRQLVSNIAFLTRIPPDMLLHEASTDLVVQLLWRKPDLLDTNTRQMEKIKAMYVYMPPIPYFHIKDVVLPPLCES